MTYAAEVTAPRRCDMCQVPDGAVQRVMSFSLTSVRRIGTAIRSRGAGSMRLCEQCWRRTAAPRRREQRVQDYWAHYANRKLTTAQARAVREAFREPRFGLTAQLARQYGVSGASIRQIADGRTYREAVT